MRWAVNERLRLLRFRRAFIVAYIPSTTFMRETCPWLRFLLAERLVLEDSVMLPASAIPLCTVVSSRLNRFPREHVLYVTERYDKTSMTTKLRVMVIKCVAGLDPSTRNTCHG